jgi:hypothetical protein
MADRAHLERLTRELTDAGLLVEAGWIGLRIACDLHDAPKQQLDDMRNAFFAGAQHVFHSITGGLLEDGVEPTQADLNRMDNIDQELRRFIKDFEVKHIKTVGTA